MGNVTPLTNLPSISRFEVRGGAVAWPGSSYLLLHDVLISTGGVIMGQPKTRLDMVVLGNLTIETGSAIDMAGLGFGIGQGPGAGVLKSGVGSGGGHGGRGGNSSLVTGGVIYESEQLPVQPGSGGGNATNDISGGSLGGGALRLNVLGTLTVDGQINADGTDGLMDNAGGGAGGSVLITADSMFGAGQIVANGGGGDWYEGGGGGGGRIAVYTHTTNGFKGLVSVNGGEGYSQGGEGSIFYSTNLPALMPPNLACTRQESNLICTWEGFPGVTYQVMYSHDLINWYNEGNGILGTLSNMTCSIPVHQDPNKFYRLKVEY